MDYVGREAEESELVCAMKGQNTRADASAEAIRGAIDACNREQMVSGVSASKDALIVTLYDRLSKAEKALALMWFAYENKDSDEPHEFECEAVKEACAALGGWANARALAFGKADESQKG